MTPFAAFGICILLTLFLIVIFTVITRGGVFYLIYMVSAALIEEVTRKIAPIRKQSATFTVLIWLLVATAIILISFLFFGIFCLFYTFPDMQEPFKLIPPVNTSRHPFFIVLGKSLLLMQIYFLGVFIYYRIKISKARKAEGVQVKFPNPIIPALSFVCAYIYLIAAYYYLTGYPAKESIGLWATIAGILYTLHLLYWSGKTIYMHIRYRTYIFPSLTFVRAIQQLVSLAYNSAFLYFFYNTSYMLTFF